jgi:hypothetical protein
MKAGHMEESLMCIQTFLIGQHREKTLLDMDGAIVHSTFPFHPPKEKK